jgi:hypothetical protein
MTCGIAREYEVLITTLFIGRLKGFSSSTAAELMGLFGVIVAAPPTQNIVINLDNMDVVNKVSEIGHRQRTGYSSDKVALQSRCNGPLSHKHARTDPDQ